MPAQLHPDYLFEHFIVGGSNRFAYASSVGVAEHPARRYNPLIIYGSAGLGKTHLLHAIGQHSLRLQPATRVLYTSAEQFVHEMIGAIQQGHHEEFRSTYRLVDLLLIDDIQFIADNEAALEEFFPLFNALYDAQKQIVLTSDRHPKAMTALVEGLRPRCTWCLIADVQPPDLETRIAILQEKAVNQPVSVPKPVIDYVARRVRGNIRELEGTLTSITAMARMLDTKVTLKLATSVLDTTRNARRDAE